MKKPESAPRGGLAAIGESLRLIAQFLEEEEVNTQTAVPAAPEIDYSELNYKNLQEAAKAIGISVDGLYRVVHRDDFPGYKIGERWFIPKAELAEWNAKMAREKKEL